METQIDWKRERKNIRTRHRSAYLPIWKSLSRLMATSRTGETNVSGIIRKNESH